MQDRKFPVAVPGCWRTIRFLQITEERGFIVKTFQAQGNVRIECKGVSHTATVYLDGHEIGHHYNAYTPFSVVVSDLEPARHMWRSRR